MSQKALIVVDYQNDFVDPKGSLYVPDAEKLHPHILTLIKTFQNNKDLVIATKDFHPDNHCSFATWPPHCLANSSGSELYQLPESHFDKIILKGTQQDADSYSAFFSDNQTSNGLHEFLQEQNVTDLVIVGVALDVCVSATLTDAIKLNYHGYLDLTCTVGLNPHITF
ncbi:isochorismatase family protein [Spiroplasma sp. SV19]|uniref:isochorismatase family protein n=1 Tax=Spiroplasma sp. SV19 TaxID=2570468 RepID=UPI0024B70955|nr:isochorismatase family protein [Spiroplasma sp. SV19]WHQ36938.1 isochorismatase family protein [Spiroplasma sp. SV19]